MIAVLDSKMYKIHLKELLYQIVLESEHLETVYSNFKLHLQIPITLEDCHVRLNLSLEDHGRMLSLYRQKLSMLRSYEKSKKIYRYIYMNINMIKKVIQKNKLN